MDTGIYVFILIYFLLTSEEKTESSRYSAQKDE